jgi:predicted transcriptional regulator
MDFSSSEISAMVFKRVLREDIKSIPLDRQTLVVFMELDGKVPLRTVAQKAGLNMGTVRQVIARLIQNGLVEKVDPEVVMLDKDFFDYLVAHLSVAVGPIADVLIEDEVEKMGHKLSQFPGHRVAELVDNLAREVRREERKTEFLNKMAAKIKQKKYLTGAQ